MKKRLVGLAVFFVLVVQVQAAILYVDLGSANPVAPYDSWATAATNIQDGVDAAASGDTVWVTNGVYASGGVVVGSGGDTTNRVAVSDGVIVRSMNGPSQTFIQGSGSMGSDAVRCAYVGFDALLSGFTLTNGTTRTDGAWGSAQSGGGIWSEVSGVVSNCTLINNTARRQGGGVFQGTILDCDLIGNSAEYGGGAYASTLNSCLLEGNSAEETGGGVRNGELLQCTLVGNSAYNGGGSADSYLANCVLRGNTAGNGGGGAHLGALNNCVITGNSAHNYGGGYYYDSGPTLMSLEDGIPTSAGELNNCTITENSAGTAGGTYGGTLNNCIVYYNLAATDPNYQDSIFSYSCTFPAFVGMGPPGSGGLGNISDDPLLASASHLSTNSPCIGAGSTNYVSGVDVDGEVWATVPSMGCDELVVGFATSTLQVEAHASHTSVATGYEIDFLAEISGQTTASEWHWDDGFITSNRPFASHSFTSDGVYDVELIAFNDSYPSGVTSTVSILVSEPMMHYVNISNPAPTAPYTSWESAATNLQDAVDAATQIGAVVVVSNGVYEAGGRAVAGTMTNRVSIVEGLTVRSVNGPEVTTIKGGGSVGLNPVRCAYVGKNSVLAGFTLTEGATRDSGDYYTERCGGGIWCEASATVSNCVITGNSALRVGGGVYQGTLVNCEINDNSSLGSSGGGVAYSTLFNCVLTGNEASYRGGGAIDSVLNNCVLFNNYGDYGGGAALCTMNNTIVIGNAAGTSANEVFNSELYFSCSPELSLGGFGNITNAPAFIDPDGGDFRLDPDSACIDAGTNGYVSTSIDLAGNPRIQNGIVDMGAYEWLQEAWVLNISKSFISETTDLGGSPSNNSFEVWNAGSSNMNYSLSSDVEWMTLSPAAGSSTGEHDPISVLYDTSDLAVGSYTGQIEVVSGEAPNSPRSIEVVVDVMLPVINSESFEDGMGIWMDSIGNDTDWSIDSGSTPSSSTGPSGASEGTYYIYTEASSHNNETAQIEATFDFSSKPASELVFDYHMYGSSMGSLSVFIDDGVESSNVWSRAGQQHASSSDSWITVTLDLASYATSSNVTIRFKGIIGDGYASDMALDNIVIYAETGGVSTDDDGDGLPNDWETFYFAGATNANADAICSNGVNTVLDCYIAGLDPTDSMAWFLLSGVQMDDTFTLDWDTVTDRVYSVYWSTNLIDGFQCVESNMPWASSEYVYTNDTSSGFFKVEVDLP